MDIPPGSGEEVAAAEAPEDPLRSGSTEADAATSDPVAEARAVEKAEAATTDEETAKNPAEEGAAKEDEAPAPDENAVKKPVESDTSEPAPPSQTAAAGEDKPSTPSEQTAEKPSEDDGAAEPAPASEAIAAKEDEAPAPRGETAEPSPEKDAAKPTRDDTTETGAAGEEKPMAASGELLKKADDDISDLVSGRGTVTAREDGSAPPSDETAQKFEKGADDEPATKAEPSPAAQDEAPAPTTPAPTANAPTANAPKKAAEEAAEPAADTRPATTGKEDAPAPAKPPALRGTDETAAPPRTITIRELLEGTVEVGEHDVFYVHAVTPDDRQGVWGIIQKAVTENFARGVRLTIEGRTDTYQVAVPPHADEILDNRWSSPLGLMIHRKSRETIIYNRKLGRLTLDPDVTIYPGNELVIVGFQPEELMNLYKHFAGTDGG